MMDPHRNGRLMHVTIKIVPQTNVKLAAFVLVLMGNAKERQNLLAHLVMMVMVMRQPLATVTAMAYA